MAVVVSSNSGKWHYAIKHFICDAAADVRDLPIDGVWPGSTAYVVDTCESYIFNSSREWIKITNNSSGSGAGLAATIQIGNVTTGQPGSDVTITNSGTTSAAVFDFSIPRGEPFQIKEVYDSVAAMKADYNNPDLNVGDLVAIVSDPSDPDNASLYVKGDTQFEFFMDLSGAQGIQGPAGPQGEKGDAFTYSDFSPAQLESLTGPRGPQGPEGNGISNITQNPNGTLTITMDDGDQYTVDAEALIDKMDKTNPTGTGYFSLNRKADTTTGNYSFAEGYDTTASGFCSHAKGESTEASGYCSYAEGYYTTASGDYSHAEGAIATASGGGSHAEGNFTIANHAAQHVFGEYNIADPSAAVANTRGNYVEIVGNGTSVSARSNARTLDWDGNETLAGNLTIGGTPTNNDHAATKKYVDDAVAGGGGGSNEPFYLTETSSNHMDKTIAQLLEAVEQGKVIYFKPNDGTQVRGKNIWIALNSQNTMDDITRFFFSNIDGAGYGQTMYITQYTVAANSTKNSWTVHKISHNIVLSS